MKKDAVIVLDCGATNIRAVAVDGMGQIIRIRSFPNQTIADPHFEGGLIWDSKYILQKIIEACRSVCQGLDDMQIKGVCTTSFGVDGAAYDKEGNQIYPVISWACERTKSIIEEVHDIFPLEDLHNITGLNQFHFNTIYKLYWLKKHRADIFEMMDHWLFMPAIISGQLCNTAFTDVSMLGTSMLCDRNTRGLSKDILSAFGIKPEWFPKIKEAGEQVGFVTADASKKTGIPEGVPVFASGHDTQFAVYGSGAGVNEPVLSSGTWEILMLRTPKVRLGKESLKAGITTEFDALPGLYNPGLQWLASKHIEELKTKYFAEEIHRKDIYDIMIAEAEKAESDRGKIFLELLKKLTAKTKISLQLLEESCYFKSEKLFVVGGGSKNKLWNKLRADSLGIEIKTIPQAETTVVGAAKLIFENIEYR